MSKKINFRASNNLYMFQFFKQFVHQKDNNVFFCDGSHVQENPGVIVDFTNIEHTYEIFHMLGRYWGGWNSTPTSDDMYGITKIWEEKFGAEIIDIGYDTIDFHMNRELSDNEIDLFINEIKGISAEANYTGGVEELKKCIKEESKISLWWD